MKWLEDLKLAIINKDIDLINSLIEDMPEFEKLEEMQQASALIKEGIDLIKKEMDLLVISMDKMKKSKKFLELRNRHGFDRRS